MELNTGDAHPNTNRRNILALHTNSKIDRKKMDEIYVEVQHLKEQQVQHLQLIQAMQGQIGMLMARTAGSGPTERS